jgi:hypothetical protein
MKKALLAIGALAGSTVLLALSVMLLRDHFQSIKDVSEYGLPLAADIPPLERRSALLTQQTELSALEANLRTASAQEKLHVYVLPESNDVTRILAFLETVRTFLERRKLLTSMEPIAVGDPVLEPIGGSNQQMLESRTLTLTATLQPQGRLKLFSILQMSGLLTVGDALSSTDIKTLFDLTENQNYAGIIPVEQFLSADLQDYAADPTIPEERLKQAMSSEEFLSAFHHLLDNSQLPAIVAFLKGDLGRALLQQKLY